MGFKKGAYATIWEVQSMSDTFTKVRLSTSRKDKTSGEYVTDFSGFVAFVGTACAQKAIRLKPKDRIQIDDCEVTNKYDKEKKREYTNFTVFNFFAPGEATGAVQDLKNRKAAAAPQRSSVDRSFIDEGISGDNDEEELPF